MYDHNVVEIEVFMLKFCWYNYFVIFVGQKEFIGLI